MRWRIVLCAVGMVVSAVPSFTYQTSSGTSSSSETILQHPANSWRQATTANPLGADNVSASIRSARDGYFDSFFGLQKPIDFKPAERAHIGKRTAPAEISRTPELPLVPNRVLASGT